MSKPADMFMIRSCHPSRTFRLSLFIELVLHCLYERCEVLKAETMKNTVTLDVTLYVASIFRTERTQCTLI
jgi:hypothetical protein